MYLTNPLTIGRGDSRYALSVPTQLDGFDNATDYVILGAAATYRSFVVEYVVELPVSKKSQIGTIEITHNGVAASLLRDAYSFDVAEISGLTFSADLNAGNVRLVFTKLAVGENPTLFYRVSKTPVV